MLTAGYTSDGLRAWKQDGATGTRTYFLYDGTTPIIEILANGTIRAVNTFGANGLASRRAGTSSVFYTFDERGNTSERTDGTGQVLTRHAPGAFGLAQTFTASGGAYTGSALDDPFADYQGKHGYYRHSETNLFLCTFRYFDLSTWRMRSRFDLCWLALFFTKEIVTTQMMEAKYDSYSAVVFLHFELGYLKVRMKTFGIPMFVYCLYEYPPDSIEQSFEMQLSDDEIPLIADMGYYAEVEFLGTVTRHKYWLLKGDACIQTVVSMRRVSSLQATFALPF